MELGEFAAEVWQCESDLDAFFLRNQQYMERSVSPWAHDIEMFTEAILRALRVTKLRGTEERRSHGREVYSLAAMQAETRFIDAVDELLRESGRTGVLATVAAALDADPATADDLRRAQVALSQHDGDESDVARHEARGSARGLHCALPSCAVREEYTGQFKKCGSCLTPAYCSKACQTAHWPAHKADCKRCAKASAAAAKASA